MPEYASNAKGNAALTTGIIGTALGGINALGGLGAIGVKVANAAISPNRSIPSFFDK